MPIAASPSAPPSGASVLPEASSTACRCAAAEPDAASIARAERRLRLLAELTDIGMALARDLERRALADAEAPDEAADEAPAPARDPADAFARVSRAVRLTLALEARTDADLRKLRADLVVEVEARRQAAARRKATDSAERAVALEDTVSLLVGEVIDAESPDLDTCLTLQAALHERLEQDEAYLTIADRPLRETVERLCADLLLTPDWSRWTGEDWGPPAPWSRTPGSPFARPSRESLWFEAATPAERRERLRLE